ncbi:MAG: sulfotransferase domain-containing protein [Phycisphaeraceae bacterium]|nr:sulfotransferase domain-containing protein [Phycisphaeraceae bacterium]MBX3405636.1 sulfotransferase domain-containing protein [Phycisphaeraceae bacterium]
MTAHAALRTTLAPVVHVPTVRFVTTAMPKSGSNWFEAMLFGLPGVGGYGEREDGALLLALSHVLGVPEFLEVLRAGGLTLGDALARMLEPGLTSGEPLPESARTAAAAAMSRVQMRIPARAGLIARDESRRPRVGDLLEPLFAGQAQSRAGAAPRAVGCPSKHEPPGRLHELLPGYRILQLIRDPRDVLVSRFYHDLAHVNPGMIGLFARRGRDGTLTQRDDWVSAYFGARRDELREYYADFDDARLSTDIRLIVRYEDLLADAPAAMLRAASFVGVAPALRVSGFDPAAHCDRFAFERVTAGDAAQIDPATGERRNSFLRSGKSGDWRNYFDRALVEILGPGFATLLVTLGYERDSAWIGALPDCAPRAWDFSRLRPRQSLVRSFRCLWEADAALHERYPNPTDLLAADGGFLGHIVREARPEVMRHRADLIALARLWNADTRETVAF